jgi:hypothetical protein
MINVKIGDTVTRTKYDVMPERVCFWIINSSDTWKNIPSQVYKSRRILILLSVTPCYGALPEPIINAAGVAIPRAQGHAMMITETNARSEKVTPMPPTKYHPSPADIAINMTAGTKYFAN